MSRFLSAAEEQSVIQAIHDAESNTSGEVRVHIQRKLNKDIWEEAQAAFFRLKMHETRQHNGVLFFVATENRQFVILADKGINDLVPEHFWEEIRDLMKGYFRRHDFGAGLSAGIRLVGEKLKAFFPVESDNPNELDDDLSFDED